MNFTKRLKHFLLKIFILPTLFIVPQLPKWIFPYLATFIFAVSRPFLKKDYAHLDANLNHILKLDGQARKKFSKACMYHQVICGLETLKSLYYPDSVAVEGLDEVADIVRSQSSLQKGLIVITAHLGSWEMSGRVLAEFSPQPTYVLAKPAKQKFLTTFMTKLRERQKNLTVIWNNDPKLLRRLVAAIKEQSTVGIVMDQRPNQAGEPDVLFFDKPTDFVTGPAKLALQYGAPIMSLFCLRLGPFHYRCIPQSIAYDRTIDSQELNQILATQIENKIRQHPEQWTWNYRRWQWGTSS